MEECGWDVNVLQVRFRRAGLRRKGCLLISVCCGRQFPPSIHICITRAHTPEGVAETFIKDMSNTAAELMKDPSVKVAALLLCCVLHCSDT